tara:strand:- start:2546 stop:2908 length:363 start_codon:yes stop_codon:yes gene_type:complete
MVKEYPRTAPEYLDALRNLPLGLNFIMADKHGNIGYQQTGNLPVRKPGLSGLLPMKGWDSDYDWKAIVGGDDLLRIDNPADGILLTCNNLMQKEGGPLAINLHMGDYRPRRLHDLLSRSK